MGSVEAGGGTTGLLDPARRRHSSPPPPIDRGGGGDDGGGGGSQDDAGGQGPGQDPRAGVAEFGLRLVLVAVSVLFLIFGALQWKLRSQTEGWPPPGAPQPPATLWLSTLLLALSSVTLARAALRAQRGGRPKSSLGCTLALGGAFLGAQTLAGAELLAAGATPSSGAYGALFFALIGLHGVHVVGGLAYLAYLTAVPRPRATQVRLAGVYWHFMGLIWFATFSLLWWPG